VSAVDPADLEYLASLVERHSGIMVGASQGYLLDGRLVPLARALGLRGIPDLVRHLRAQPASPAHQQVVEALTTNETSFFRDQAPFRVLQQVVFPSLRGRGQPLRIWSAACSTGQEAVSIAMLLRDQFPLLCREARIVGTDLNRQVVERARAGLYSELEVARGLSAELLARHFQRREQGWTPCPQLRALLEFRVHNLLEELACGERYDLVMLRNVLIYFAPDTRLRVLQHVHQALRSDGWLMLGAAETMSVPAELFQMEFHPPVCLFRPRAATGSSAVRDPLPSTRARSRS
jgi:chemotaxis protein methyltransferase CheR